MARIDRGQSGKSRRLLRTTKAVQELLLEAGQRLSTRCLASNSSAARLFSLHKHPRYASAIASVAARRRQCLDLRCADGLSLYDGADPVVRTALREAVCFLGCYQLEDDGGPAHQSATCRVLHAKETGEDSVRGFALKLMSNQEAFLRELQMRHSLGHPPPSSSQTDDANDHHPVVPVARVHLAETAGSDILGSIPDGVEVRWSRSLEEETDAMDYEDKDSETVNDRLMSSGGGNGLPPSSKNRCVGLIPVIANRVIRLPSSQ